MSKTGLLQLVTTFKLFILRHESKKFTNTYTVFSWVFFMTNSVQSVVHFIAKSKRSNFCSWKICNPTKTAYSFLA